MLVNSLTLRFDPRVEGFADTSLAAFTRGKEAVTRALAPRREMGHNSPGEANRRLPSRLPFATRAEVSMRHSAVPSAFRVVPVLGIAFALAGPAAADTGYSNVFTIDLRTAQCTLSCSATVPASGTAATPVAFQATATPSSCSGTPSYAWTFGDGATSTQQNPSYTYAAAGTFNWSMTASISGVTCARNGTIVISGPSNSVRLERLDDIRTPLELESRPGDEFYLYFALKKSTGELLAATSFSYDVAFTGASPAASGAWAWSVQGPGVLRLTLRPDLLAFTSNPARVTFPQGSGMLRVDGVPTTLGNSLPAVGITRLPGTYTDVYDVYGEGSAGASGKIGFDIGVGVAKASLDAAKLSVKGSGGVGFSMELGPDGGLALERRMALNLAGSVEIPYSELKVTSAAKINGPSVSAGAERGGEFGQRIEYPGDDALSDEARVTNAAFFLETAGLAGILVPHPWLGPLLKATVSTANSLSGANRLVDAAKRETWLGATIGGSLSAQATSVRLGKGDISTTSLSLSAASLEGILSARSTRLYEPGGSGPIFDGLENRWSFSLSGGKLPFLYDVQLGRAFGQSWSNNYAGSAAVLAELTPAGSLRTVGVDLSVQSGTGLDIGLYRTRDYDGLDVRWRLGNTTVLGALRNEGAAQLGALAGSATETLSLSEDSASSIARYIVDRAEAVAPTGVVALLAEADRKNGRVQGAALELDFELAVLAGLGLSVGVDASWEQAQLVENAVRTCRADGKTWSLQKNEKPASWRSSPSFSDLLSQRVLSGVGPLVKRAFENLIGRVFSILGFSGASAEEGLFATAPLSVSDPTTGRIGGWATFPESYRGWSASLLTGDPARPEISGTGVGPGAVRWAYTTREVFDGAPPSSRRAALEMAAVSPTRLTLIGNFVTLDVKPSGGATPDPLHSPVTLSAALYADQATRMGADLARLGEAKLYRYDEGSGAWLNVGGSLAGDSSNVTAAVTRPGTYAPGILTTIPAGDSDGDGLLDSEEDRNGNGIVDAGESDPYNADTDGDGVSDRDERAKGTDPLDAASVPNRAPVLGYLSNRTLRLGESLSLSLRAADPDGHAVRFSATGLPSGASLDAVTGSFRFTPQQAGTWRISFTATDVPGAGAALSDTKWMALDARRVAADGELTSFTRAVPVVLDVYGANRSHYTTELTLTNRGNTTVSVTCRYQASIGDPAGSGAVADTLAPGEQRTIPNVISYLRSLGLPIPTAATAGSQGGALLVKFDGAESEDSVAATARTTTATSVPQPAGAAGLSYAGAPPLAASEGVLIVYGLRDDANDRANVAVFNPGSTPVTVRLTAFSGDGTGYSTVVRDSLVLPAFGWSQISNVFSGTGIASGWVTVQRTSSSGRFGAYGVINDNATNDGSFVLPTAGTVSGSKLTVPVLVETSAFRSELVLANRGSSTATLTLRYVERLTPSLGSGGTATVQLRPREQLVIPDAIQYLRNRGIAIGAMGAGSYAGALRVSVSGVGLSEVFAGARTASPSPAGGQFGLFTPGVYESETAGTEAYVFGLRADATSRSNVAIVNAGGDGDGSVTLEVQVYDGDRGGAAAGSPRVISLSPGQWEQITGILGGVAVQNGWVRVRRTAGTAGWIAYGVVNDGGQPGQRTGDGAYVPMTTKAGAAQPPEGNEVTYTLPGGVPLVMVRIPAGTFQMGSPASERGRASDETLSTVTLTKDYLLSKYLITGTQWKAVMMSEPYWEMGPDQPEVWVTYDLTTSFLLALNAHLQQTGQPGAGLFRLPTEAEWERAARTGSQSRFPFGDALECGDGCSACSAADPFMFWCGNSGYTTRKVDEKQPNAWGLYGMLGHVYQWTSDWYGPRTSDPVTDPAGPSTGDGHEKVTKGGAFYFSLENARPAARRPFGTSSGMEFNGLRVARSM